MRAGQQGSRMADRKLAERGLAELSTLFGLRMDTVIRRKLNVSAGSG